MFTSPLRIHQPLHLLFQFDVETHSSRLQHIIENLQQTLKVFVIGEVKAGKSSLINILVGQQISPTNILEATASLWEIGYGQEDTASIEYHNGLSEKIPFDQVQSVLSITNQENLEKAKDIAYVKVRTRKHDFRELLLIDSPGLATVTEQNAQLTRNVLEDVDIALWVLNANHLGQTDIMQEVENLAQLGKPIIAVISKIDEVDTSPERLIKYVNRHAGEYFTEVFALSAHSSQQNDEYFEYFEEFKTYLKEQVSHKAKDVKKDSVESSLEALHYAEKAVHESIIRQMQHKLTDLSAFDQDLEFEKEMLISEINSQVDSECTEICQNSALQQQIKAILLGHQQNDPATQTKMENLKNTLANPFSKVQAMEESVLDQIVNQQIYTIHDHVQPYYISSMKSLVTNIQQKSKQRFTEFRSNEELLLQQTYAMFDYDVKPELNETYDVIDTTMKATVFAGVAGTMAAGYTAVLGANAAAVTMGAAMSAIALPVVVCGAVLGSGFAYFQNKKNQDALQVEILRLSKQIQDTVRFELLKTYHQKIESDIHLLKHEYAKGMLGGYDINQFRNQMFATENYVRDL
jgi:small GTP-binding protein